MSGASFEGAYLAGSGRLPDDARLECGICWWVYDPAVGDDGWRAPPGTPFSRLPEDWHCPNCDADKNKFMALSAETPVATEPAGDDARLAALEAAYREADRRMRGLPVHNPRLGIDLVGFRRIGDLLVGVAATPWCMNLVVVPDVEAEAPDGSTVEHVFPSGAYGFILGRLGDFGRLETCSLFSPMDEFDDPAAVRIAAESVMSELFVAVPAPEPAPTAPAAPAREPAPSRRALFFGSSAEPAR